MNKGRDFSSVHVIVNEGEASDILHHLIDKDYVSGGTMMMARGTASSRILKFLELHHQRKEFLMMAVERDKEEAVMEELEKEFGMDKRNAGIAFSTNIHHISWNLEAKGEDSMEKTRSKYEAVFVIVDRGYAEDVVDLAHDAGGKGATILHGRGSGTSVTGEVFDMVIEPEKDIVLMLIKNEDVNKVINNISTSLELEKPGMGIIFAMDVNRTVGLAE